MVPADLQGQLGAAGPQHGRGVAGRQRGDSGTPRPGTDDRHSDGHALTVIPAHVADRERSWGRPPPRVRSAFVAALTSAAVIVPVKAFNAAKVRLVSVFDPPERAALARCMAEVVLVVVDPLFVVVVCDDDEVRAWATAAGARVVWCPGRGLNGAVADGVTALAGEGVVWAVVAHADLPL